MIRDSKSKSPEFGTWEKQPGVQFSLSFTGKRESMRR